MRPDMKVVLAQLNFTIGDFNNNGNKILSVINSYNDNTDLIVFSELCVTGYPPLDLIEKPWFIKDQNKTINKIAKATAKMKAAVAIGVITERHGTGKPFYNSAILLHKGKKVLVTHKQLLPTYDIFDEVRFFEPGTYENGFGIFDFKEIDRKIGFLICEDMWNDKVPGIKPYYNNPVDNIFNNNSIDLLVSLNASPSEIGKHEKKMKMFSDLCNAHNTPLVYVNQVGAFDDITFDGNSFVIDSSGKVCVKCKAFKEDITEVTFNSDNEILEVPGVGKKSNKELDKIKLIYNQTVLGIRDYCDKLFLKGIVVGSSGGIDSAVVIALATAALGSDRVKAITMPSQFSSPGSVDDSVDLCQNLGVELITSSIKEAFDLEVKTFTKDFGREPSKLTKENMQARIRGLRLMSYSNEFGNIVVSTGNKTEVSVGFFTIYGDSNGGISVISDLWKMEVYALARYINFINNDDVIPEAIIDKAPSPELSEDQKDSDSLPVYNVADAVLKLYIESNTLSQKEKTECRKIIKTTKYKRKGEATAKPITKQEALRLIKLVDRAEFKRRQSPPTIRVHSKAFGFGRRIPVVQQYTNYEAVLSELKIKFKNKRKD